MVKSAVLDVLFQSCKYFLGKTQDALFLAEAAVEVLSQLDKEIDSSAA